MDELGTAVSVLLQLYLIAAVMTVVLEQVFDTDLYRKAMGKGPEAWLGPGLDFRPYFATLAGIGIAVAANLTFLTSGLGIDMTAGLGGAWGPWIDRVLTGILIGGGSKTVKKLATTVASAREQITSAKEQ